MPSLKDLYQAERQARRAAEQTADRLARLQTVMAALSDPLTSAQAADAILTQGLKVLGANTGVLSLRNEAGTDFRSIRIVGYPPEIHDGWRQFPVDAPLPLADAVRERRPVILETAQQRQARYPHLAQEGDHPFGEMGTLPFLNGGAWVALPLFHGQTVGGLEFGFSTPRTFGEEERTFLQTLAGVCAQALERARLYDAERLARERAEREIEQRRQAEAALRESEERYHTLADSVPGMVWTARPDGSNNYVSQRWYDYTGLTPEQSLGFGWTVAVHPDDLPGSLNLWKRHLETGEPGEAELRLRRRDGTYRWFLLRTVPRRDEQNRVLEWFGTSADIDDRKRAAEALRESEERFRRIVETSAEGIWVIDAESRTTYINQRMAEMLGTTVHDMLGRFPNDFLFAEDLEEARNLFRLKRQGDDRPFDFRLRRTDDSAIWCSIANRPLYADGGQFLGVLGMFSDITDRKRLEESLRQSEQHYRAMAESIPGFVFTCAPDGRWEYCNRAWHEYTGLTWEQSKDFGWRRALHPEDASNRGLSLSPQKGSPLFGAEAAGRGEPFNWECRFRKADGVYRWFLVRVVPLQDERGRLMKWFGICTDIDDQKRLEEALKEADRRKDRFLAMLAHELRNPLAPIHNAAQIIKRFGPPEPNLQWAREIIDRQVQHLTRLVDDLLDISRITHGKLMLQREPVELAAVVTHALDTSRPLIEARQQELTVSLPRKPVWLDADRTRLAQVVANLLHNAAKYTPERGRIWLTVTKEGEDVVLRVQDTGMGIPAELLPRVFDLFTQGERSPAGSGGGLGIGLTLVKSLVEMHRGGVRVSSDGPGKGSEFVVRLPTLPATQAAPVDAASEQSHAPAISHRILVVDDNADATESQALLLRATGHKVCTAHDGPAALEAARAFRPEIAILDVGLPGMDGYELARQLRREFGPDGVMLVAMTGYGQEDDRRRAQEAGFDYHFIKPVDPDTLQALLIRQGTGSQKE